MFNWIFSSDWYINESDTKQGNQQMSQNASLPFWKSNQKKCWPASKYFVLLRLPCNFWNFTFDCVNLTLVIISSLFFTLCVLITIISKITFSFDLYIIYNTGCGHTRCFILLFPFETMGLQCSCVWWLFLFTCKAVIMFPSLRVRVLKKL